MEILFTHPYFWPHVHRGAERELHDAGALLAAAGNRVRLLTSQPDGLTSRAVIDGIDVRYVRTPLGQRARSKGWDETSAFARPAYLALLAARADVVHSWHYPDGAAAVKARQRRKSRNAIVLKLTGTVRPHRILAKAVDGALIQRAVEGADEVWCNSEFARSEMAGFGVPMRIVPAGVDPAVFHPVAARTPEPTAFVASASDEPRKRLVDVFDAWPEVAGALPTATLRVAGHASAQTQDYLLGRIPEAVRQSVRFLGLLDSAQLAAEFSAAWCVLAPAVYEALGLVTIEALACGTPVVGARSGATIELLDPAGRGALVEPLDPTAWAGAITEALATQPAPGLASCLEAAEPFHWSRIIPLYEAAYRGLLEGR